MITITADQLNTEEIRLRYLQLLRTPNLYPSRQQWDYIISKRMHGLARPLYAKYLDAMAVDDNDRQDLHDAIIEKFPEYLAAIPRSEAIEAVYSNVSTDSDVAAELIRRCRLFDAEAMARLLAEGHTGFVISVIDVYQPEYGPADLLDMQALAAAIDALPRLGHIEQRKGLFSSSDKYICPNGHANNPDTEYCTSCGLNARGLDEADEQRVQTFNARVEALRSLLANQ